MNETQINEMRQLREAGATNKQVGERYGISAQRVHQILGPAKTKVHQLRFPSLNKRNQALGSEAARALPGALMAWRARNNLTQYEASQILHLSVVSNYSNWERGVGCSLPGLVLDFIKLWEAHKNLLT